MSDSEYTEEQPATSVFDPDEAAELLGLTEQQKLFALAILKGSTQSAAAKAAGYAGSDKQLRTVGSRTAKCDKVRSFIAWAQRGGGGTPDEPAGADELLRILSKIARSGDKNAQIRASEALIRLKAAEREAAASQPGPFNPENILNRLAETCGVIGVVLARASAVQFNMRWVAKPSPAVSTVDRLEAALNFRIADLGLDQLYARLTDGAALTPDQPANQTPADRARDAYFRNVQTAPLSGAQPLLENNDAS